MSNDRQGDPPSKAAGPPPMTLKLDVSGGGRSSSPSLDVSGGGRSSSPSLGAAETGGGRSSSRIQAGGGGLPPRSPSRQTQAIYDLLDNRGDVGGIQQGGGASAAPSKLPPLPPTMLGEYRFFPLTLSPLKPLPSTPFPRRRPHQVAGCN